MFQVGIAIAGAFGVSVFSHTKGFYFTKRGLEGPGRGRYEKNPSEAGGLCRLFENFVRYVYFRHASRIGCYFVLLEFQCDAARGEVEGGVVAEI